MSKALAVVKSCIDFARENWPWLGIAVSVAGAAWTVALGWWRTATEEDVAMILLTVFVSMTLVFAMMKLDERRRTRTAVCFWPYRSAVGKFSVRVSTGRFDGSFGTKCPRCRGPVLDLDFKQDGGWLWICESKDCGWKSPHRYWASSLSGEAMANYMNELISNGHPIPKSREWPKELPHAAT